MNRRCDERLLWVFSDDESSSSTSDDVSDPVTVNICSIRTSELCLTVSVSIFTERVGTVAVCRVLSSDEPGLPAGASRDSFQAGNTADTQPKTAGQFELSGTTQKGGKAGVY